MGRAGLGRSGRPGADQAEAAAPLRLVIVRRVAGGMPSLRWAARRGVGAAACDLGRRCTCIVARRPPHLLERGGGWPLRLIVRQDRGGGQAVSGHLGSVRAGRIPKV
jgi:hypothetical protein